MLNAVVHHLDVVSGTALANGTNTWLFILVFGRDFFQKRENFVECGNITTGAHRGSGSGCLVSTTDAAANVADASALALVLPALGVFKVLISAVQYDVTMRKVGLQAFEDLITNAAMWKREDE